MQTTSRSLIAALAVTLAGWSHSALAADCLQGSNATGTCTVPAGVTEMTVHAIGGGGGGGRNFQIGGVAALGAGGGSYCGGTFTVTPGEVISVTVGEGGAGAVNVSGGQTGGQSSVSWGGQLRVAANGGTYGEAIGGFDAGKGGTVDACPTSSKFAGGNGGDRGTYRGGGGGGAAGSTAAGSNGAAGNDGGTGGAGGAGAPAGGQGGTGGNSGLAGAVGGTPGAGGGGGGNRANSSVNNYGGNGAAGVVRMSFNRPPVANDDAYSTPQNTQIFVDAPGLLINDDDPDGTTIVLYSSTDPAHGTLAAGGNGGFLYTPDTDYVGVDSFTYVIRDSAGALSTPATVQITVTSTNRPPNALDDAYSTPEGTALNVRDVLGLLANDTDPDKDTLTITATTDPGNGQLFAGSDGAFIYQPNPGFTGKDLFVYTVSDGRDTDVAAVIITVTPNTPPVAQNDLYNVNQDALLKVAAPGILANDSDPEGHVLAAVTLVTPPANGDMGLIAGGGFFYKPKANFTGRDTFTYRVSDGDLDSNEATVTIQVNAVNHPPVANPDSYTTPQDTILTIRAPGLLGNDTDPDGDTREVARLEAYALHGFVSPRSDGSFTYTPNPGFSGTDRFTYAVTDRKEFAVGEVIITVTPNLPPVANDDAYSTPQDTLLTVAAPGVIGNDSDPEGHALSVIVVNNPANGVLAMANDGGFTYQPNAGFAGVDSFTYRASDGDQDDEATVVISVSATNLPPVANDDSYATPQDTLLTVATPGILANDTDPEGHSLKISLQSQPANGVLALTTGGGFTYAPDAGFTGADSFNYTVTDGKSSSGVATVRITVNAVNKPPVANNDSFATPQDTLLTVTGPGLLANDSDPEGQPLTTTIVTQPANGSMGLAFGGGFIYQPNPGFSGTDSFTYTVSDGKLSSNVATVTIAVSATNLPPVANNDAYATPQDTLLTVSAPGLLANDFDPEGHALKISLQTQPTNGVLALTTGGGFTYTPNAGFSGTDSFTYTVTDGKLSSNTATVNIAISATNNPPVANNDTYATPQDTLLTVAAPGLLVNDSDPEGQALKISIASQPANGDLALTTGGGFTYTPNAGFNGVDSFTYTVTDGKLVSNVATVQIAVSAINTAPVANNDAYATPQDTLLTVAAPGLLDNDSDPEGDTLKISLQSQPANGVLALTTGGGFTYTPNAGFSGADSFTYTVTDGKLSSNVATVALTVTAVAQNQPPVAVDDAYATPQDKVLTVAAPGILVNDSDPEGQALTATIATQPANGHLVPAVGGGFSYTPNAGFSGSDSFTYTVSDGQLDSNTATVTITVTPVATNQPPVAADDGPYAVLEGTTLTVPPPGILANDSDPEGHALTVTIVTQPSNGHLSLSNGGFSYTPDAGFTGTDTFTYTVSDGQLDSNAATVTIEVTPAPAPPIPGGPYVAVPTLDRYGLLALALLLLGIVFFNRRTFA